MRLKNRFIRQIKILLNIKLSIKYENFNILAPSEHLLLYYQSKYPSYDQFLPHLASYIPHDGLIIDVGANIGDTVAGMYDRNSTLNFICIEPDQKYFKYLKLNLKKIKCKKSLILQSMIGISDERFEIKRGFGTGNSVANNSGKFKSVTLDNLLKPLIVKPNLYLLKIDVDGKDAEVIVSGQDLINMYSPLIFAECQVTDIDSLENWRKVIRILSKHKYNQVAIFYNTGSLLVSMDTSELEDFILSDLADNFEFRSASYYDLFFISDKYCQLGISAVDSFVNK